MRRDILEAIADDIGRRPVDALASFQAWDGGGRRRLDGMSKGRRSDIDREQRAWEKANKAELAKFEARHKWAKFESAHPERVRAALAKWRAEHADHLRQYRAAYAQEHRDREREWKRRTQARDKADPARAARRKATLARHRAKVKADPVLLAKLQARRARYVAKVKADPERYLAKLQDARERMVQRYVPKNTRNCGACGVPGHNRKTCQWRQSR